MWTSTYEKHGLVNVVVINTLKALSEKASES